MASGGKFGTIMSFIGMGGASKSLTYSDFTPRKKCGNDNCKEPRVSKWYIIAVVVTGFEFPARLWTFATA